MILARLCGAPTTIRRRSLDRILLRLPLAARRRVQYLIAHQRPLHLRRPQRWTEKVNWRIVYDRRDILVTACDKLAAKAYVERVATPGSVRLPRTVWCGAEPAELAGVEWPEHWVLKSNHGTGKVVLGRGVPEPQQLARLTGLAQCWLADQGLAAWGEWGYSRARRLILLEEAVPGTPDGGLTDYKVFVIGGTALLVQVDTARFGDHRLRFYTPDWRALPNRCELPLGPVLPPPTALPDLISVSETVGAEFDAVRVDLYESGGDVWFGELTAYSGSGLAPIEPPDLDDLLGAAWALPPRTRVTDS